MSLIPLPKNYLEKILKPINRLTESCVLNVCSDSIYSICSSNDDTVILYAKIKVDVPLNKSEKLNIISIKKLLSGLECLGNDGEFSIELENNNIKCFSIDHETKEKVFFKYHLVDNSIIKEAPVNINKIASLNFDTEFVIDPVRMKKIILGYSFASDLTKIYFFTKDNGVYAEINDKTLQNVDNIEIPISSTYKGETIYEPIPVSLEIFKNLAQCRSNVTVKINSKYKVFVFNNTDDECIELKYIVSALVK